MSIFGNYFIYLCEYILILNVDDYNISLVYYTKPLHFKLYITKFKFALYSSRKMGH
jgi:hypothetical protein